MTMDKGSLKAFFGAIIFMFSLALAYFSASYVETEGIMDYWTMLAIFGGAYILVGIVVYQIFPVSLGFLFSADILVLHLLMENFGDIDPIMKTAVVGVILVVLYGFASAYMQDEPLPEIGTPPAPPTITPIVH